MGINRCQLPAESLGFHTYQLREGFMRLAQMAGCFVFTVQALIGQCPLALADRQEILVEGRVLRRTLGESAFAPVPDLPEIRPNLRFLGRLDWAWDGAKAYQVGVTEDRHRVVCVGTPFYTSAGERRWFWTEPKVLPLSEVDAYSLVGAWEDSLLFLQIHRGPKPKTESAQTQKALPNSQSLLRVDLITGVTTRLLDVEGGDDFRSTALFSQDAFYLFTATGKAIRVRVRTEPWAVDMLSSGYWSEAGVTLCKETGEFRNPFHFGSAFLDSDGSILIPAQVFLPLNREDLELAWSKLPQPRKAELIASGLWPVSVDKEVGWKDDVRFLKFDPSAANFTQVERSRFEHLVVEEDKNFMIRRFRIFEPSLVFTSNGGKILLLEEALKNAEVAPASASKGLDAKKKALPDPKPDSKVLPEGN